jgi:DNA-binding response OmpR family regulator
MSSPVVTYSWGWLFQPTPDPAYQPGGVLLMIEDEYMIVMLAKTILSRAGFQFESVGSGAAAKALLSSRTDIRLILLDRNLGDTSAELLAPELAQIQPETPILLCSGDPFDSSEPLAAYVKGYLAKPFRPSTLVEAVEITLGKP